jgi:aryl sulfotransferase
VSSKLRNAWGKSPRLLQNHTIDSTRWLEYPFRDGDIVIATWAKSGSTWLQQIVSQLVFGGAEGIPVMDVSPWIDWRWYPMETLLQLLESQAHRRFVKTHLAADALVYSAAAKYIYVGRDGRDVAWSWHHHHCHLTPMVYEALHSLPQIGPPLERPNRDFRQFFHEWLDGDGAPLWPFWSNVQSWWDLRQLPNVMLVHFNELRRDLPGQIREIARFLSIDVDEANWPRILTHCSFDYMKRTASQLSPMLDPAFVGGAQTFVNRGTGGNWRDVLTPEDVCKYERHSAANLTPESDVWLRTGRTACAGA